MSALLSAAATWWALSSLVLLALLVVLVVVQAVAGRLRAVVARRAAQHRSRPLHAGRRQTA